MERIKATITGIALNPYLSDAETKNMAECKRLCDRINQYHENIGSEYRVFPRRVFLEGRKDKQGNFFSYEPRSNQKMVRK